jgi:hypothetical protein
VHGPSQWLMRACLMQILPTIDRSMQPAPAATQPPASPPAAPSTQAPAVPAQSEPENGLGVGVIAGISVGAAGFLLCAAGAILLHHSRSLRRKPGARAHSAKPVPSASLAQSSPGVEAGPNAHLEGPQPANAWTPKPHVPSATGYLPHPLEAGAAQLQLPPSPIQAQAGRESVRYGFANSAGATNASAEVHSASTTSGAQSVSKMRDPAAGSVAKAPWAVGIATRTHDTIAGMTHDQQRIPVEPPGRGASVEERMQFIQHQLDSLAGKEVLQGLLFLEGSSNRLQGGVRLYYSMLQLQPSNSAAIPLLRIS